MSSDFNYAAPYPGCQTYLSVFRDLSEISRGWRGSGIRGRVTFFSALKRGGSERIETLSRGGSEKNVPILYLIHVLIDFVTILTTCDQFNILKCLLSKAEANNVSAIYLVFILSCHKLNKEICRRNRHLNQLSLLSPASSSLFSSMDSAPSPI